MTSPYGIPYAGVLFIRRMYSLFICIDDDEFLLCPSSALHSLRSFHYYEGQRFSLPALIKKRGGLPDPSGGFPTSRTQRLIEAPLVWEFTVFIRPKRGFPDWLSLWLCLVSFLTTSPIARCRSNRRGFAFSSYQGTPVAVLTIFTCAICCLRPRHEHGGNRGTESTHTPMPAVSSL